MKGLPVILKKYLKGIYPQKGKKRPVIHSATEKPGMIYSFSCKTDNTGLPDLKKIRAIILLNPYTIATHPVVVRLIGQKNEASDLEVLFSVLSPMHGKKIEASIRSKFEK